MGTRDGTAWLKSRSYSGKAFRADSGYDHVRGTTAADVIIFDREELGNNPDIPDSALAVLKGYPADCLVWVTPSFKRAQTYDVGNGIRELHFENPAYVIDEDGDEGVLLFIPED